MRWILAVATVILCFAAFSHANPSKIERGIFVLLPDELGKDLMERIVQASIEHIVLPSQSESDMDGYSAMMQLILEKGREETFHMRSQTIDSILQMSTAQNNTQSKIPAEQEVVYLDTNHMFLKAYHDVILPKFEQVDVVVPRVEFAYALRDMTCKGHKPFANNRPPAAYDTCPGDVQCLFAPVSKVLPQIELSETIRYLIEMDSRIQAFISEYADDPHVNIIELRMEELQDVSAVEALLASLSLTPVKRTVLDAVVQDAAKLMHPDEYSKNEKTQLLSSNVQDGCLDKNGTEFITQILDYILYIPATAAGTLPPLAHLAPYQETPRKFALITQVKNVHATLQVFLDSVDWLVDVTVVVDTGSKDGTQGLLAQLEAENEDFHALSTLSSTEEGAAIWNEGTSYRLMLEKARELGATHMVHLDSDEILTQALGDHNLLRHMISSLPPHLTLNMHLLHVIGVDKYINSVTGTWRQASKLCMAFVDDGVVSRRSGTHHVRRCPASYPPVVPDIGSPEGRHFAAELKEPPLHAAIHFKFASMYGFSVKTMWYKHLEWLEGSAVRARSDFYEKKVPHGMVFSTVPHEAYYKNLEVEKFLSSATYQWRLDDILGWLQEYGIRKFEELHIDYMDPVFPAELRQAILSMSAIRKFDDLLINPPIERKVAASEKIKIVHVISPVVDAPPDLEYIQKVTLHSLQRAIEYAAQQELQLEIVLVAVLFQDELDFVENLSTQFPFVSIIADGMNSSSLDILFPEEDRAWWTRDPNTKQCKGDTCNSGYPFCTSCKKWPLARELFAKAYAAHPDADFVVYSNTDVGVQPTLYEFLYQSTVRQPDICALSVTRRDIHVAEQEVLDWGLGTEECADKLSEMGRDRDSTTQHPGHDLIIIPAPFLNYMFFGDLPLTPSLIDVIQMADRICQLLPYPKVIGAVTAQYQTWHAGSFLDANSRHETYTENPQTMNRKAQLEDITRRTKDYTITLPLLQLKHYTSSAQAIYEYPTSKILHGIGVTGIVKDDSAASHRPVHTDGRIDLQFSPDEQKERRAAQLKGRISFMTKGKANSVTRKVRDDETEHLKAKPRLNPKTHNNNKLMANVT